MQTQQSNLKYFFFISKPKNFNKEKKFPKDDNIWIEKQSLILLKININNFFMRFLFKFFYELIKIFLDGCGTAF